VLELDELWSFVYRRKDKKWIWLAQCRRTRQIVAYAVGDCSEVTCRRLWQRVPLAYRQSVCFTDFWEAYKKVIPKRQHRPGGKGAGQTCHPNKASCRTVQQHAAPAASSSRAADDEFQQERQDAQDLPGTVYL